MENTIIKTYEDIIVRNINCGKYKSKKDALQLIKYISGNSNVSENKKTVRYIGGYGIPFYDFNKCYHSMYIIKSQYGKTGEHLRCMYHLIISFPEYIKDANTIKLISIDICQYIYQQGFQCLYGVHEDTEKLHIHIAVNSTNFMTGQQAHFSDSELYTIRPNLQKKAYVILKANGY